MIYEKRLEHLQKHWKRWPFKENAEFSNDTYAEMLATIEALWKAVHVLERISIGCTEKESGMSVQVRPLTKSEMQMMAIKALDGLK
jgi:hypothetical protein